MALDGLTEMRNEHGRRIHHGVAGHLGVLAFDLGDPSGRQAKDRLGGLHAGQHLGAVVRVHRERIAGHHFAGGNELATKHETVFVGLQLEIITQAHCGDYEAHVLHKITPHTSHALQHIAALLRVRQ